MSHISLLKDSKDTKQRPLSLTQVKRMKSQTDSEKKTPGLDGSSPQLTPSKVSQNRSTMEKDSSLNETKKMQDSNFTPKGPEKKTVQNKLIRKDSRSLTAITSPNEFYKGTNLDQPKKTIRRLTRTKTLFPNMSKSKSQPLSPRPVTPVINTKSLQVETENKIKDSLPKSPIDENQGKSTPKPIEKSFTSVYKYSNRMSINSNGSNCSLAVTDGQFDLLSELTKSVKELNQRLIRSEEITMERLKENIELKKKLETLESKIDEQKTYKLESSGVSSGCSNRCIII